MTCVYMYLFAGLPQWHPEAPAAYLGLGVPDRTAPGTPPGGADPRTGVPTTAAGWQPQVQHVQGKILNQLMQWISMALLLDIYQQ